MLEVKNLSVRYETDDAAYTLRDLSFRLAAGERTALMGPNGAGKSTLMLALTGVLPRVSGTIQVNGIPLEKKTLRTARRGMGLLFQNPDDQLFMPTVYEDVAFGPRQNGMPENEIEPKVDEVLARLGISHLKHRMTHRMSGGEKRLAALAGLLVMEPSVLLMDEPTSFLDPRAARRLVEILNGLPHTLLVATHDRALAQAVCHRLVMMKDGTVFFDGPATALWDEALLFAGGL